MAWSPYSAVREELFLKCSPQSCSIPIKNKYSNVVLPIVLAVADYIAIWLAEYASFEFRILYSGHSISVIENLVFNIIVPAVYFAIFEAAPPLHDACSLARSVGYFWAAFLFHCHDFLHLYRSDGSRDVAIVRGLIGYNVLSLLGH